MQTKFSKKLLGLNGIPELVTNSHKVDILDLRLTW